MANQDKIAIRRSAHDEHLVEAFADRVYIKAQLVCDSPAGRFYEDAHVSITHLADFIASKIRAGGGQ